MGLIIPANCQVRAGGHTVTFRRDMHPHGAIGASDVLEMDGRPVEPHDPIPPALMLECVAIIRGKHPDEVGRAF